MTFFTQWLNEKKKKQSDAKNQTTATSSPLRGANQDYSGVNVKNDSADYTISDEKRFDEAIIAGVNQIRTTPANMGQSTGMLKTKNAPPNAASMQNAADKRVIQMDRVAQQQRDQQQKDREDQQKLRIQAAKKAQGSLTSKKAPTMQEKAELPGHEVDGFEGPMASIGPDGKPSVRRKTIDIINAVIKNRPEHMPVKEEVEIDEASAATQSLKQKQKSGSDREHKKKFGISPKRFAIKQQDPEKPTHHKLDVVVHVTKSGEERKYQDVVPAKDKHAAIFNTQRKYENFGKKMGYTVKSVTHRGMVKEEMNEAKKESEARDLGDRHIIMQARKVISTRGAHHITFNDGKTHAVSPGTAHRLISHHDNLSKPSDKEAFAAHAHSSLQGMKDALAGKKPESKPAISLGGSKNVGGVGGSNSK